MKNKITILKLLCVLFFYAPSVQAQKAVDQIFKKSTTQITSFDNKNLTARSTGFNQSIDLGEYGVYDLFLEQTYLFSDSYRAKNKDNIKLPQTFKGTIQGQPNTTVSLTTNDGFLSGFINTGEEVIFFEPYKSFDTDAIENELIVYYQKDVINQGHACAANHTDQQATQIKPRNNQFKSAAAGCYEAQIFLVADHDMRQKHGSTANTLSHITSVLNNVQTNYDNEFNDPITFIIAGSRISSNSGMDLWSGNITNGSALLAEFQNSNFANGVTYDLASLWVTRDLWDTDEDGDVIDIAGLADTPGLCGVERHNLIEDYTSNAASLQLVLAHEIGHNFSAEHDDEGSGTIMAPSGSSTNTWSTQSLNQINAFYPEAFCLCTSGDVVDLAMVSCGSKSLSGDVITINDIQIKNNGTTSSSLVGIGWYLSTDNNITPSDYLIDNGNIGSLDAGTIIQLNNINIDLSNLNNVPSGNYYLGTIIDYGNAIAEYSEDNNACTLSTSADINIVAPATLPDLDIIGCAGNNTGVVFNTFVAVKNRGDNAIGESELGVYLSTDNTIDPSDYLIAIEDVPALGIDEIVELSFSVDLATANVPEGDYYMGLFLDPNTNVTESNETNNSGCTAGPIPVEGVDCMTDYIVPANHTSDEDIQVSNQITSQKIVPDGLTVSYDAGVRVRLQDGFHAQSGSTFHAFIEGCAANKEETVEEPLLRNYPNPFTGHTNIEFTLSKDTDVILFVSDVTGKQIAVLLNNEQKTEGTHLTAFDGSKYAAGMYYYTIQAGEHTATQKMILIK